MVAKTQLADVYETGSALQVLDAIRIAEYGVELFPRAAHVLAARGGTAVEMATMTLWLRRRARRSRADRRDIQRYALQIAKTVPLTDAEELERVRFGA